MLIASDDADTLIPIPKPNNSAYVIMYERNVSEKAVSKRPTKLNRAPVMATCRNENRRNMGPFKRPVQADIAGWVLMIVVICELVMPSSVSLSRNIKPNCCSDGNIQRFESPAAMHTTQAHPPSGATKLSPRSLLSRLGCRCGFCFFSFFDSGATVCGSCGGGVGDFVGVGSDGSVGRVGITGSVGGGHGKHGAGLGRRGGGGGGGAAGRDAGGSCFRCRRLGGGGGGVRFDLVLCCVFDGTVVVVVVL